MRDYLSFFLFCTCIAALVYVCDKGPEQAAYEVGQTISAFKAGIADGSARGMYNLNDVFQGRTK